MTAFHLPESTPPSPHAAPDRLDTAVFTLDEQGRVREIPKTVDTLLTRSPSDCLGRSIDEILPEPVGTRILETTRQAPADGPPVAIDVYHPAAQRWFDVHVQSTGDGVTVAFRDRTAHEQSTTLLHLLDATVLEGLWHTLDDGTIVTINSTAARFLGYDEAASLEGQSLGRLIADVEGRPNWDTLRMAAAEQGSVEDVLCTFRRREGTHVTGRVHLTAVHDQDGQVTAFNGRVVRVESDGRMRNRRGLLDRAVEATDDAVAIAEATLTDAPGPRIVYVNPAFTGLTGYTAETAVGSTAQLLYGPGTDRDVLERLQTHVANGRPYRGETVLYRRDGTPYVSQWSVAPIRDESGTLTHWVALQRDVTEDRNAAAALRERDQQAENFYASLTSLLEANTTQQVAREAASLVTEPLGLSGAVVRQAGAGALAPLAMAGASASPAPIELDGDHPAARAFRSGAVTADDARLHVPVGSHGVLSVEDDETEDPLPIRPLEVLAAHTARMLDRLARAAAQRAAHERSEALRKASRALLDGPSEPTGAEAAFDAIGPLLPETTRVRLLSFGPDDETAHVQAANDRPLADLERGTAWPVDAGLRRFQRDDGLYATDDLDPASASALEQALLRAGCHSYVAVPLLYDESVRGILLLAAEAREAFATAHITLAEETADLLASALLPLASEPTLPGPSSTSDGSTSLKTAFLSNVHHELRTPLTSIIGFAEVLSGEEVQAQKQFADLIARSGRRLAKTFDALVTLSRLEAGTMTHDPSPLSVAAEVRTVVESFREQARAADVSLDWAPPDTSPDALIDADGLHDIVHQLLDNAIKFTEAGGTVTVRLHDAGDPVVLDVADTGIGMAPDRVPDLVGAFRQGSTGLDRSHEGCGVGLALVWRWVDAMGGTVDVDTALGEGTTVKVRLPRMSNGSVEGERPLGPA